MKNKLSQGAVLLVALFLFATVQSCTLNATPYHEGEPTRVKLSTMNESDEIFTFTYSGVVEEGASVALSFATIGTIEQINVSEGDFVVKGQVLARLNNEASKSLFDAAESTLKQAQDAHDRLSKIHENGSLPEIQMVEVETKLSQARASYSIARKNLNDCTLQAPFDGVIGKRTAEVGQNTAPGLPLLTLLDINSVKVKFSVPENDISSINKESVVGVVVPAIGNTEYSAKGVVKCYAANAISHTYPVHVVLSNSTKQLLPGMVCRVKISKGKGQNCIAIPINVVQTASNGQHFVWIEEGGIAKRRIVTTGRIRGNGVEIISGLLTGDRVVTEGYLKLSENDKICEQ